MQPDASTDRRNAGSRQWEIDMKALAYIVMVLLALTSISSAGQDKVALERYNITFDLNTSQNYTIQKFGPLEGENSTTYTIIIEIPNRAYSQIIIDEKKAPADATMTTLASITYYKQLWQLCTGEFLKAYVKTGEIDGKDALIAYAEMNNSKNRLLGDYFLDGRKLENTQVSAGSIEVHIVSEAPTSSTEGMAAAESLIETIHIERREG
jgi:hypothetical protein